MCSRAHVASCVRLLKALASEWRTWLSTVRTDRCSSAAITLFARPLATKRTTSTSRAAQTGRSGRARPWCPERQRVASLIVRRVPSSKPRSASGPRMASQVSPDTPHPLVEERGKVAAVADPETPRRGRHPQRSGRVTARHDARLSDQRVRQQVRIAIRLQALDRMVVVLGGGLWIARVEGDAEYRLAWPSRHR